MPNPSRSAPASAPPELLVQIDRALRSNDLAQAAQLAQRALEDGAVHPLLFEVRGRWKKHQGCLKDALDDLQRAHTLAPKSAPTLCELAECLNGLGRPKQAVLACGDALAIDGAFAAAWLQKAIAHRLLNQPDRARDCFLRAVELEPAMTGAPAGTGHPPR